MGKPIRKILVVICTYNPNDRNYNETFEDFSHVWFDVIRGWQMQRSDDLQVDIVVVDNVSGPKTRSKLIEFQKQTNSFCIDFIDEWFSGQFIGFNHALSLFKDNDTYDYFAYCASDAYFNKKGDLQILLDDMDEKCGFISPQADSDMIQRLDFDRKKPPTRIRCGEAVNNHLCILSRKFMEAYNHKYIDILGGPHTEGFYPYACAAIGCHELLSHKVCITHLGRIDGSALPSDINMVQLQRRERRKKSIWKIRKDLQPLLAAQYKRDFFHMLDEGTKVGLGFEEVAENWSVYKNIFLNSPSLGYLIRFLIPLYIVLNPAFKRIFNSVSSLNIIPKKITVAVEELQGKPYLHRHDPNCFDENGYAKTDELYHFIKENLFLKKDELDYEKIPHKIYPV